jgi:carboxypeptidase Taq
MANEYVRLKEQLKKIKSLSSIVALLEWDQETMMPHKAGSMRAMQLAELKHLVHQKITSRTYENALAKCIDVLTLKPRIKGLDLRNQANLKLLAEEFLKAKKLPSRFVKELATHQSQSTQAWAQAKANNRLTDFLPYLTKMIDLMRRKADFLGYDEHPYDALLNLYEPKMTIKSVDELFHQLIPGLKKITREAMKKGPGASNLSWTMSAEAQLQLCRSLKNSLGLSDDIARLDTSNHPFCESLHPLDIRMTTKIKPEAPLDAIGSTLHEVGHGLYEAGLPIDECELPGGEYCSLGVHESQSRLFETFIGQSLPFMHFLCRNLSSHIPHADPQTLYRHVNIVQPSLIRIESDEVTYCLHIALRYQLEKELIEGTLSARDLPEKWNALMQSHLGLVPPNDATGCLQDIHWSSGLFGYFPTYALGNIYAAMIYEHLQEKFPELAQLIAAGNFTPVVRELTENIYRFGKEKKPQELIESASKRKLSCQPYLNYLERKYLK